MTETALIIAIVSLVGSLLTSVFQIIGKVNNSSCNTTGCALSRDSQNNITIDVDSEGHLKNISIPTIEPIIEN
jgi:hypothetical protein